MRRANIAVALGLLTLGGLGACSGRAHPLLYVADLLVAAALIFTARRDEA